MNFRSWIESSLEDVYTVSWTKVDWFLQRCCLMRNGLGCMKSWSPSTSQIAQSRSKPSCIFAKSIVRQRWNELRNRIGIIRNLTMIHSLKGRGNQFHSAAVPSQANKCCRRSFPIPTSKPCTKGWRESTMRDICWNFGTPSNLIKWISKSIRPTGNIRKSTLA